MYVAWWNLENLFDVFDSAQRPAWLAQRLAGELAGWTQQVLDRKVEQLASIIQQMNAGDGPDILGVCEVENLPVLQQLVAALAPLGRNYGIAHHDMSDGRGIDVAFIYDQGLVTAEHTFNHVVRKRNATRDLYQVNFRVASNNELLILVGNHWPSRSGGVHESEPYRIMAGETLSYWMERILDIHGPDTAILVMGDFNDEPWDRSLREYALSVHQSAKVLNAQSPKLLNLMWEAAGERIGTYYYSNTANVLDQILVSRGLVTPGGMQAGGVSVLRFPEMVTGGYPDPRRFSRPSTVSYDPDGFSDHYPVICTIAGA